MILLFWIITFSLIGSLLGILLASTVLLLTNNARNIALPHLVSIAIGALLGTAFLGLIPHALETELTISSHDIGLTLLLSLLTFFLLEKLVIWRHCHHNHCDGHLLTKRQNYKQVTGTLILFGDTIHNFIDGILIAAAFMTDFHLGIVTAIAIATHEVPQELGDFIILLHSGFSRSKALCYNILSSLGTVAGALLAYFALSNMQQILPYVILIAASSFIYIAVADLIPGLHNKTKLSEMFQQIGLIAAGAFFIYITHSALH